jgi:hypothetical protein
MKGVSQVLIPENDLTVLHTSKDIPLGCEITAVLDRKQWKSARGSVGNEGVGPKESLIQPTDECFLAFLLG